MNAILKQRRLRIGGLTLVMAGLFVLVATRLAVIVLIDGPRLVSLGRSEHSAEMDLAAARGPIFDRSGKPLALSAETGSIYARPHALLAAASSADQAELAKALGLSSSELQSRLSRRAPFVWLARHLAPARARAVERLGLEGVGVVSEYKRFYPESNLAAAVVGLAGTDGQGLSGVELQYDKLVRGEPLQLHFYHDALGHPIFDSPLELANPRPGARLQLTIDSSIQAGAENYLAEEVVSSGASRAAAVVLDPFTGEVLALANVSAAPAEKTDRLHNTAVQDVFEPGSTMKGLLSAIALQDRVLDTSRSIYCEQGEWQLAGTTIHDDGRYGWLTLGGILEVSSNIGAAKIALALGRRRFYQGVSTFGLGDKTGIDLPGEARGLLPALSDWRPVELADHGFGQGVAVTPIQLATAYAAIANGGALIRPYVLKAADDADGQPILRHTAQTVRRVISPAVAHTMNRLLRGVVNGRDGTAHLAQVADLTVAGKTGTAQMVDPNTGRYYRDRLVASFVGFLPADDPKLVILVVLYNVPRGRFGGLVAAPVFSKIASDAVQQLSVAPSAPAVEAASVFPSEGSISGLLGSSDDSEDRIDPNPAAADSDAAYAAPAPASPANDSAADGRVPDFHGLSLRSALALARSHRLALEVSGEGYVVHQQPRPDTALASWSSIPGRPADDQLTGDVRVVLASDFAGERQIAPPSQFSPSPATDRPSGRLRRRR